jgi:hypothetical protein
MGHNGQMGRNGIQEATSSPRERLAAASARRTARDGRKAHILKYRVFLGKVAVKNGVLSYVVERVALTLKPQTLKPASKQVEKDAMEAAKAFMADYEADLRELAKL